MLPGAVLSYEFARLWGRAPLWTRYAVAQGWCICGTRLLSVFVIGLLAPLVTLDAPSSPILRPVYLCFSVYVLWLYSFLARQALALSVGRVVLQVLGVGLATLLLVLSPWLFVLAFGGSPTEV